MDIILDAINAFFYAIVEGITEWLPISSTGHLILYENFFPFTKNVSDEFMGMFEYLIQLGAILAIVCLFFNRLNPFSPKKNTLEKKDTWQLWFKVIVACIPAIAAYLLFNDVIEKYLVGKTETIAIAIMLILYGFLFIVVENLFKKGVLKTKTESVASLTYTTAILIGCFQVLSIIPGTSRSGVTILGAMILCCSRTLSAEFSFFIAIPAMVGTSALKCLDLFLENGINFSINEIVVMLVGMLTAFVVSLFCAKFLMNYVRKHDFKIFGYYRIVLGIVLLLYFCVII